MQRVASPRLASRSFIAERRVVKIRAPVAPIGWPSATAPPRTLTFVRSRPQSDAQTMVTAANASLISKRSIWSLVIPSFARVSSMALAGAVVNHSGAPAAPPYPTMRAKGSSLCSLRPRSLARTRALAPSLMLEAVAAVIVPSFEKAGLRLANFDGSPLSGPSSSLTAIGSPFLWATGTASISDSNSPSFCAAIARRKLSLAYWSCCSRVRPYLCAHRSPQLPIWTLP